MGIIQGSFEPNPRLHHEVWVRASGTTPVKVKSDAIDLAALQVCGWCRVSVLDLTEA